MITVAADWEEEEASTHMNLMIDHWITIRGFSHAAAYGNLQEEKSKGSLEDQRDLKKI